MDIYVLKYVRTGQWVSFHDDDHEEEDYPWLGHLPILVDDWMRASHWKSAEDAERYRANVGFPVFAIMKIEIAITEAAAAGVELSTPAI